MSNKVLVFASPEEAEAKTGYFSVSSLMITPYLTEKITSFIYRRRISTFSRANKAKTSHNIYTLNFTLKRYDSKSYIQSGGAIGYYKSTLETVTYKINPGHKGERISVYPPREEDLSEFASLQERSPTMMEMYFWICRKYPDHILWMKYADKPVQGLFGNSGFAQ